VPEAGHDVGVQPGLGRVGRCGSFSTKVGRRARHGLGVAGDAVPVEGGLHHPALAAVERAVRGGQAVAEER